MRTLILLLLCIAKTLSQEQNSTTNPAVDQKLKKIIENIDVSNLKVSMLKYMFSFLNIIF